MSFIIDETCEFIHVPKAAGRWVENVCHPWTKIAGTKENHGHIHSLALTDLPSFAVARDPYSWMKSCVGYTQKRWLVIEKGWPGWFGDTEYRKIGLELKSLRTRHVHIDKVLKEYLKRMPGEYSRASLLYYEGVDRLVSFGHLYHDTMAALRAFRCPHAMHIDAKARVTGPMNTSKDKQTWSADPKLIAQLREAEHEWYEYMEEK